MGEFSPLCVQTFYVERVMYEEILGGYEILGDSVNDLLEGEFDDDIIGDDFELVGDELLLGDNPNELLLGAGIDDFEDEAFLGISQSDMIGAMSPAMKKYLRYKRITKAQAPARREIKRRRARRAAIAARVAAQSAAIVREKPPTESREYPMGFDTVGTVAAGANVQIISRPQVTFRPERLVIGGAIAASFLVNDIKVGKNSQLTNSAALPGDAFAPTAFGVRLRMDTAQVSMDVVLDVTNISAGALRFNAALFGKAIQ
jgi:hypothetical protein